MTGILRVSALTWDTLPQFVALTPDDIMEITAHRGMEVEELAAYLERRFPGLLIQLATRYLDEVLSAMPAGKLPSRNEVVACVTACEESNASPREVTRLTALNFEHLVSPESPGWAIQSMIAMMEYGAGNWIKSLRAAGFARNELDDPNFPETMRAEDQTKARALLLQVERAKAVVLIAVLNERRMA